MQLPVHQIYNFDSYSILNELTIWRTLIHFICMLIAVCHVVVVAVVVVVVVVVWGPESGCTAACRLIEHTSCVFNVPILTARKLHVTTTLEILAAKSGTFWA
jgi:hypothetical protein